jgi:hypothetical protein
MNLAQRELERVYNLLDWLERDASPTGFRPGSFSLQDIWLISAIGWTEARIKIQWRSRPRLESIIEQFAERPSILATIPSAWHPGQ